MKVSSTGCLVLQPLAAVSLQYLQRGKPRLPTVYRFLVFQDTPSFKPYPSLSLTSFLLEPSVSLCGRKKLDLVLSFPICRTMNGGLTVFISPSLSMESFHQGTSCFHTISSWLEPSVYISIPLWKQVPDFELSFPVCRVTRKTIRSTTWLTLM